MEKAGNSEQEAYRSTVRLFHFGASITEGLLYLYLCGSSFRPTVQTFYFFGFHAAGWDLLFPAVSVQLALLVPTLQLFAFEFP